jgi:hypothetical protein
MRTESLVSGELVAVLFVLIAEPEGAAREAAEANS